MKIHVKNFSVHFESHEKRKEQKKELTVGLTTHSVVTGNCSVCSKSLLPKETHEFFPALMAFLSIEVSLLRSMLRRSHPPSGDCCDVMCCVRETTATNKVHGPV